MIWLIFLFAAQAFIILLYLYLNWTPPVFSNGDVRANNYLNKHGYVFIHAFDKNRIRTYLQAFWLDIKRVVPRVNENINLTWCAIPVNNNGEVINIPFNELERRVCSDILDIFGVSCSINAVTAIRPRFFIDNPNKKFVLRMVHDTNYFIPLVDGTIKINKYTCDMEQGEIIVVNKDMQIELIPEKTANTLLGVYVHIY